MIAVQWTGNVKLMAKGVIKCFIFDSAFRSGSAVKINFLRVDTAARIGQSHWLSEVGRYRLFSTSFTFCFR